MKNFLIVIALAIGLTACGKSEPEVRYVQVPAPYTQTVQQPVQAPGQPVYAQPQTQPQVQPQVIYQQVPAQPQPAQQQPAQQSSGWSGGEVAAVAVGSALVGVVVNDALQSNKSKPVAAPSYPKYERPAYTM